MGEKQSSQELKVAGGGEKPVSDMGIVLPPEAVAEGSAAPKEDEAMRDAQITQERAKISKAFDGGEPVAHDGEFWGREEQKQLAHDNFEHQWSLLTPKEQSRKMQDFSARKEAERQDYLDSVKSAKEKRQKEKEAAKPLNRLREFLSKDIFDMFRNKE